MDNINPEEYFRGYREGVDAFWEPFTTKAVVAWKKEQDKKAAIKQNTGTKVPNYGAIGGAYTYSVTPTSLGNAYSISNSVTGESLNVTDYSGW
jgi:hypothetical protein